MNSRLRLIGSIGLFSVLILPFLAGWGWMAWKQGEVKSEVRAMMADGVDVSLLIPMRFSPDGLAALDWKDPHEFEFEGKLYDIIRRETEGGQVLLWCYLDHGENHWKAERRRMVNLLMGNDNHRKHQQAFVQRFVKTLVPVEIDHWAPSHYSSIGLIHSKKALLPDGREHLPPTPPPENWV